MVTISRIDDEPADLMWRADGALYVAKHQGRNRTIVADMAVSPANLPGRQDAPAGGYMPTTIRERVGPGLFQRAP